MRGKTNLKKPLISVIMPVYNAGNFINEAIESILNQTYKNFEFIIIDDASTDNSWQIIKTYQKKDKRIKAFKNKRHLGISKTINKAIKIAKGDFIARMDADDIALPERLEKQINFMLEHPDVGILGTQMIEKDEEENKFYVRKNPLTDKNIKENLFINQTIQTPTLMINRKNIPKNLLQYNPDYFVAEDLDFYFKLVKYTKFANLPDYLVIYRKHKDNTSLKEIKKTFFLTLKARANAIKKYNYKPKLSHLFINLIQSLLVFLLPENLLYKAFRAFKSRKTLSINNLSWKNNSTKNKIELSLIVPVYKAENFIEKNIKNLNEFLKSQHIKYEIIAVVDGKVDKSFEILINLSKKLKNLRVYCLNKNYGKGYAVKFGIKKAKYSYVGFVDAGFDIHLTSLENMIKAIQHNPEYDAFIGDKTHPLSFLENVPFFRKLASFGFRKLTSLLINTTNMDTQTGLKIFKGKIIKKIVNQLPIDIDRFAFDVEIIKELLNTNTKIMEIPVVLISDKRSTLKLKDILQMAYDLILLSIYYNFVLSFNIGKNRIRFLGYKLRLIDNL